MSYSIGYKIVRPDLTSLYANGHYDTFYRPGELAYDQPGTVGVMFFDTIAHCMDYYAAHFGTRPGSVKILRVEYDSSTVVSPVVVCASNGHRALDIYHGIKNGLHPKTCAPPKGTLASVCVRVLDEWKPN